MKKKKKITELAKFGIRYNTQIPWLDFVGFHHLHQIDVLQFVGDWKALNTVKEMTGAG